jgi:MFS family permease
MLFFVAAYMLRGGYTVAWSLFAAALGEIASDRFRARAFALGEIMGGAGYAFAPFAAGWLYEFKPVLPLIVGLIMIVPRVAGAAWINRTIRSEAPALIEEPV